MQASATFLYPPIDDSSTGSIENDSNSSSSSSSYNNEFSGGFGDHSRPRRSRRSIVMSHQLASNFEVLKKRKVDNVAITLDHVALAEETADLAALEIARMQRAVAELESFLEDEDDDDDENHHQHANAEENDHRPDIVAVLPIPLIVVANHNGDAYDEDDHVEDPADRIADESDNNNLPAVTSSLASSSTTHS